MKRKFECGHVGKGRFCHRCLEDMARQEVLAHAEKRSHESAIQERKEEKQKRRELAQADIIDLSAVAHLPVLQDKARAVISAILSGASYTEFGGKRLISMQKEVVSIPIGYSHRLIFRAKPIAPVELLSHEDYNKIYV